jgi:transcriptional regulator with GAF, ATPase, and Fis domain
MSDRPEQDVTREGAVIDALVHLADTLVAEFDVIEFLQYLTRCCVELIDVDEAAVMLASPSGHLQAVASSSEISRLLELLELQNHDGPCLDAFRSRSTVSSADLELEAARWPAFTPEALEAGIHAVHSVPMKLRDEVIGALNLFRRERGALERADALLARALSDIATIGVIHQRTLQASASTSAGLQHALTSRIRIEQAKGILAERSGHTVDEAFELLRTYARQHQRSLSDVAARVVDRTLDIRA